MKETVLQMYFIAIVLPSNLNEEILSFKKLAWEKFDCRVGLRSPAHITIVPPFWMEEENERQLVRDVETLSHTIPSFFVVTHNFSAFKPRTIFIDVQKNEQLDRVKKISDEFFKQKPGYKIKMENRPFHPHITIATRDLYKKTFYEAWQLFGNKEFKKEWRASGLSVLRHNKKNWDVIHTSVFQ